MTFPDNILAIHNFYCINTNNLIECPIFAENAKTMKKTFIFTDVYKRQRKTFESLPKGALPNRRNIVLSRREGAVFALSLIHISDKFYR